MPAALERRVLALVGEVIGLLEIEELSLGLLVALRDAVPAEWCALNELPADLPRTVSLTDPVLPQEAHEAFARYGLENPLARRYLSTREGRALRFSDVVTRRELHRLELYQQVYKPLGIEYQMAFMLPSGAQRVLGVSLSRTTRDFTATERDLLNLARPYLIQVYRNALSYAELDAPGRSDRHERPAGSGSHATPGRRASPRRDGTLRPGHGRGARHRSPNRAEAPGALLSRAPDQQSLPGRARGLERFTRAVTLDGGDMTEAPSTASRRHAARSLSPWVAFGRRRSRGAASCAPR